MTSSDGSTSKKKSGPDFKGFAAGTLSGLTKLAVGHPWDTLKIRLQCSPPGTYRGPIDCFMNTIRKEGPRALYKGASPPAVGWAFSDSVLMGSLHRYRLALSRMINRSDERAGRDASKLPLWAHGVAGVGAGWTVCLVVTPIEHLKAKLQMQTHDPTTKHYTGPIDAAKQIVRHRGVFGLWHGFSSTILFRSWFGPNFMVYNILLTHFNRNSELNPDSWYAMSKGAANFWAGGLASEVFWLGSFPFDAVKNRLMSDSITEPKYTSWRSAARSIWNEGGPRAFYRGFTPTLIRAFPTNASAIFVWETAMRLMNAEEVR